MEQQIEVERPPELAGPARSGSASARVFVPRFSRREWDDWRWQWSHRLRDPRQLDHLLSLSPLERRGLSHDRAVLPFAVTPYYMRQVESHDPRGPLRRCVVPSAEEAVRARGELDDPLCEDGDSPCPGLVHRYPDRVLLLATNRCAVYCRYCTRSRLVGRSAHRLGRDHLERSLEYIRAHDEIWDVVVSGGDPLTLEDEFLEHLLSRLRAIPHVQLIRVGTKVPAVLPQRITSKLVRILKRFRPLWASLHFTHPSELTPEVARACERLADAGIPMGSQTVLLRGINDDPVVLRDLFRGLLRIGVRPYYLYQCDPIPGSSHFRTPVEVGTDLIRSLRGFVSGYAVPTFVIDAPGGGGKIPVMPDYGLGRDADGVRLRNYEGREFRYPDVTPGPGEDRR